MAITSLTPRLSFRFIREGNRLKTSEPPSFRGKRVFDVLEKLVYTNGLKERAFYLRVSKLVDVKDAA